MFQPSFHPNSTCLLFENAWSKKRSFLVISECQLQAISQNLQRRVLPWGVFPHELSLQPHANVTLKLGMSLDNFLNSMNKGPHLPLQLPMFIPTCKSEDKYKEIWKIQITWVLSQCIETPQDHSTAIIHYSPGMFPWNFLASNMT
ncbi:uncharacterized protein VP01_3684g2 [Puccinia sorghi]|uniref:Uncharacterized protein n=1 Tax=Puccinia sorghi TaxID=27349 RepID=A0A0L6UW81_9BASI|nr:uncharacterized protein VP01_3684g2 [Puccinia sorghi]